MNSHHKILIRSYFRPNATPPIRNFFKPLYRMPIIERPIGYAQNASNTETDEPRLKHIREILLEVTVDPSDPAAEDDY